MTQKNRKWFHSRQILLLTTITAAGILYSEKCFDKTKKNACVPKFAVTISHLISV